jgi:hypothetical protein
MKRRMGHKPTSGEPPANGEWFLLVVNYGKDRSYVVQGAGGDSKNWEWKYLGPKLSGTKKLRVKLVSLDSVSHEEAEERAHKMGCRLVGGQAIKAFKFKFPESEEKGPIVFGGCLWQHPNGKKHVPYLDDTVPGWGAPFFYLSADRFLGNWRWLVAEGVDEENSGS